MDSNVGARYARVSVGPPARKLAEAMQIGREEFFTMRFHLIGFITIWLSWSPVGAAEYKYPYHFPFLATARTAFLSEVGLTPLLRSEIVN
ncbi:MAG: hypothetical protein ACREP3_09145, partial [Candidatus Binatia bacterium]